MKSLLVEPHGNNFLRGGSGRTLGHTASRLQYLQQKTRSVLSLFLGEWFLDTSLGLPYIPETDSRAAHRALLEGMMQARIMEIDGITRLARFEAEFDPSSRSLSASFVAETDAGLLEVEDSWNTG